MARMYEMEVVLANPKALRALSFIAETLADVEEDMHWRDDVKKARRACRYALRHLKAVPARCLGCAVEPMDVRIEGL